MFFQISIRHAHLLFIPCQGAMPWSTSICLPWNAMHFFVGWRCNVPAYVFMIIYYLRYDYMGFSINGAIQNGLFIEQFPLKWMMTGASPISGNLHILVSIHSYSQVYMIIKVLVLHTLAKSRPKPKTQHVHISNSFHHPRGLQSVFRKK